jgi:hypothetical protein
MNVDPSTLAVRAGGGNVNRVKDGRGAKYLFLHAHTLSEAVSSSFSGRDARSHFGI